MAEVLGKEKGVIFNIQRFSIHDGEGIRTIVFMKGCPLKCIWCCNPESQNIEPEVLFLRDKCIGCMHCVQICPLEAMEIDRKSCRQCGSCARVCPSSAKRLSGRYVTVDEMVKEVEKDRVFYRNSGGGITVSGGEPMMQPEFVAELLRKCHIHDIHTAIETSGFAETEAFLSVIEHVDEVFFDLKHMNSDKHKVLTGVSNEQILKNAAKLPELGKKVTFRIPLIPDCNDEEENIRKTGEFVSALTNENVYIEILPYHRLGEMKFEWLDKIYDLKETKEPPKEQVARYQQILKDCKCNVFVRQ
ncbi:glycyl-radical enzyme activating protein [Eubacteriales bacterium DFI.9.88]|nr:glycyl-radical enzyme activating protein [Eubacteriales bacterium DFI.9.88]